MNNPLGKPNGSFDVDSILTSETLAHLETSLREVGDYGEVHLIIDKGSIRFIRSVKSVNVRSSLHDRKD